MTLANPNLLIIDDQMESIALLLGYLQGQALDIQIAISGEDGICKAIAGHPDIILLDVAMPDMDGYEVCRRLKTDCRTRATPVIFLSANTTTADKLRGFSAGGVDYIAKPFSPEEVLARIYVHLNVLDEVKRLEFLAITEGQLENGTEVPRNEKIMQRALAYLQSNLAEWPGLEKLARLSCCNENKLEQLFKMQFGMTVYDYLLELRLEKARAMLAETRLQIQLIAEVSGYRNASDFSRAFRRRFGLGPRQYRQSCNNMPEENFA